MEAAVFGHILVDMKMVAFNTLLQMFRYPMLRLAGHQACLRRFQNRRWTDLGSVRANLVGPQQRLIFQRLAKEPFGGIKVTLCCQQKIHGHAVLVNGPVEIPPRASNFDVGFINTDRATTGTPKLPQALFVSWCVSQNPAVHRAMINLKTAFEEHAFEIADTQRIAQVLSTPPA